MSHLGTYYVQLTQLTLWLVLWSFWMHSLAGGGGHQKAAQSACQPSSMLSSSWRKLCPLGHSGIFSTHYLLINIPGKLCLPSQPRAEDFIDRVLPAFVWDSEQVLSENKQVFVEMWPWALDTDLLFCSGDSFSLGWGWFLFMIWLRAAVTLLDITVVM